jgi:hypothetical protein
LSHPNAIAINCLKLTGLNNLPRNLFGPKLRYGEHGPTILLFQRYLITFDTTATTESISRSDNPQ